MMSTDFMKNSNIAILYTELPLKALCLTPSYGTNEKCNSLTLCISGLNNS
jgi:hypothetical protein